MTDTVESFSAMLHAALGARIDPSASSFLEMFAEDGVMEFPFALPGGTPRIEGREQLAEYLAEFGKRIRFDSIGKVEVLETADPQTVVVEFEGFGRGIETDEPYEQRYVSIIRTTGGRIVHYKDYWNPVAIARALHGSDAVSALTNEEGRHG